jgi:diguanylate cyclase (GGDEF)-like protein/PAS domain S-box-containing protein
MTSVVLAEYLSPQASVREQVSDVGATYTEYDTEFLEIMEAGEHDISQLDDPDISEAERAHMEQYGAQTILYIPLLIRGQLIGFAELWESRRQREFTGEEIALCHGVAQQAAIAIENARLFQEVEERRVYLEGVLREAPDAIITLDNRFQVVEWNAGAERLFGYLQEEAVGQHLDHLVTDPDVFEEATGFTQRVLGGKKLPPTQAVRYRKDGSPVDVIVAGSPILMEDEVIGVVAVYTDITERVRMEETLRALALVDDLTGLYNRRGFFTLAEQQLKASERAQRKMALLFADFDGLKQINDAFGHLAGDRALIETANVLKETFRESDIIARIGGDEFVVLATETNGSPTEVLTARLQENLEARNTRRDRDYKLSLSLGLARYNPECPCSIDDLLIQADRAMYERKQGNSIG